MKEHETPEECKDEFLLNFGELSEDGIWMAAVWSIDSAGKETAMKTTCKYPKGNYTNALLKLKEILDKELGLSQPKAPPTPLEIAGHILEHFGSDEAVDTTETTAIRPDITEEQRTTIKEAIRENAIGCETGAAEIAVSEVQDESI